jgi:hypothetical protein
MLTAQPLSSAEAKNEWSYSFSPCISLHAVEGNNLRKLPLSSLFIAPPILSLGTQVEVRGQI